MLFRLLKNPGIKGCGMSKKLPKLIDFAEFFLDKGNSDWIGFDLSLVTAMRGDWNQAYVIANKSCVKPVDSEQISFYKLWQIYCLYRADLFAEVIIFANKCSWGICHQEPVNHLVKLAKSNLKMEVQ